MVEDATDVLVAEILSDDIGGLSLHALLGDKEVKAAIIAELRDTGVPAPGIAYRLLVFGIGGCERFLGGSIKSRLTAYIDRSPAFAKIVQKILNLRHGSKTQDELKSSLLNSLNDGNPVLGEIHVDEAISLETIIALHTAKSLEELDTSLASLGDELVNSFRDDLKDQLNRLVGPNIGWHDEAVSPDTLSSFDRLKYTSGIDDFVGRDQEIDLLHHFAGDPSFGGRTFNFRWMLMTGPGGEGKSRLAYHFTRKELSLDWEKGKLDYSALKGFADPEKWRPNRPTFIVIDYAQSVPEDVHSLLEAFSRNAPQYEFPVRLLLLERSSDESWTSKILPETSSKPIILRHNFGEAGIAGTPVLPLLPEAVVALMQSRVKRAKLVAPEPAKLLELAHNVDPRGIYAEFDGQTVVIPAPRPLFALAAAEQVVATLRAGEDLPDHLNQEDVLSGIIQRDRDTIWRKVVPNEGERRRCEMGLAISTLAQGIELADLSEAVFGSAVSWLPPAPPEHNEAHLAAFGFRNGHWPAMEPDILGEFFLSEQLLTKTLTKDQRNALIVGALTLGKQLGGITLLRMARDFPERLNLFDLPELAKTVEPEEVLVVLSALAVYLTGNNIAPALASLIFDGIFARKEKDYERSSGIALELAKAAVNISNLAGKASDWGRVEAMLSRLDALRAAFPQDQEIALKEAQAAVNILAYVGMAGAWGRVEALLSRLDALRAAFPQNQEIALEEANAAVNISNLAGKASDSGRVEAMLSRLDALRAAFPQDQEIALREAQAAVNISNDAGVAGDWGRVEALLSRLDALRAALPQNREIALGEAKAAVNISNRAGVAGDWERVEAMLSRLDALRAALPQNREIALQEAKAAVNISTDAGKAGDWERVEAMLSRLDALRAALPQNREIALREAQAAVNILANVGMAGDWGRVEAMLSRLDALRAALPQNREIALEEAKAAVNISSLAGKAGDWGRVEAMLSRFDALIESFGNLRVAAQDDASYTLIDFRKYVANLLEGREGSTE